ncbi:MAG TPA: hypothetical protein VHE54_01510 [Puia sp.]|nr:hypothetical protein [Puia sp.]
MNPLQHLLSAVLLVVSLAGFAQHADTSRINDPVRDSAFRFAEGVFSRPSFVFETLEPDIPADMQPILIRMNNAIMANKDWFIEYRNKYGGGQSLPYDEHFGITREQYREVQHMESQPPQLVPVDSQKVAVHADNDVIQFKSDGNTHLLDYLVLDIRQQQLMYGGDTLPFKGAVTTPPSDPYGQWQGYTWRLERTDITGTLESGKPTARVVQVDLGRSAKPGNTYLRIEYQDMKAGVTTANLELIGFIR